MRYMYQETNVFGTPPQEACASHVCVGGLLQLYRSLWRTTSSRQGNYSSSMAASISRMVNHSLSRATRTACDLETTPSFG